MQRLIAVLMLLLFLTHLSAQRGVAECLPAGGTVKKLVAFEGQGVSLQVVRSGEATITAQLRSTTGSFSELLVLENPARAVIDIVAPGFKLNKNIPIDGVNRTGFNKVRFGSHADKLRVVFDFTLPAAPKVRESRDGPELCLVFGDSQTVGEAASGTASTVEEHIESVAPSAVPSEQPNKIVATVIPTPVTSNIPVVTPTVAPTFTPSITATPSQTPLPVIKVAPSPPSTPPFSPITTPTPEAIKAAVPSLLPTPLPSFMNEQKKEDQSVVMKSVAPIEVAPPVDKYNRVTAISFIAVVQGMAPTIKIGTTGRVQYKLIKRSAHLYQLVLKDVEIKEPHLMLAHYPPQDFIGFTHVLAEYSPEGSALQIGVDPRARLTAYGEDDGVVLKAEMP